MADSFYNRWSDDDTSQTKKKIKLYDNRDDTFRICTSAKIGAGDDYLDAWGNPKMVTPYSLFHGIFTLNVPPEMWIKYVNNVEDLTRTDTAYFYSHHSKLIVKSNGATAFLKSKRHPRYQPDRSHEYANSVFLPNPNATGTRRFGLFNEEHGVFFELHNGDFRGVVRRKIDGVVNDTIVPLTIPFDYDLAVGNIFNIKMQWRGVGDIWFYMGNPATAEKIEVGRLRHLGTSMELSIPNPNMPLSFESIGDVQLECGCVDLTSWGGVKDNRQYATADSGEVALTLNEKPVLAIRIPDTFNGFTNTRDCILSRVSAYANYNTILRAYYTRDATAITATWTPLDVGFQECAVNGAITAFDTTKMLRYTTRRILVNQSIEITNSAGDTGELYLTHGDYVLVTMQAKNNTQGGCGIDYAQEI